MACNGGGEEVLTTLVNVPSPSPNIFNPLPHSSEDVELIQYDSSNMIHSWKIKKQSEIWGNTINPIQTSTYRLNINEWFKYEKGANLFNWSAL